MSHIMYLFLVLAFVIGVAIMYLICKVRLNQLRTQLVEARTQLTECTEAYKRERESSQQNMLTVQMFPYKKESGDSGYFSDDRHAEIGYQYQLFVQGLPCFNPHKVAVEILSKKEVNVERINQAMKGILTLIEGYASKNPAFIVNYAEHLQKAADKKDV